VGFAEDRTQLRSAVLAAPQSLSQDGTYLKILTK
jgi:hypothetical protein